MLRARATSRPLRLLRSISAFSKAHKAPVDSSRALFVHSGRPTLCHFPPNRGCLGFATAGGAPDYSKEVNEINLKFAEAREEIEAAMESKETIYFDKFAEAREAVQAVLDMFEGLLGRLPEKDRTALQRSMRLKIEQLKAELKQLKD